MRTRESGNVLLTVALLMATFSVILGTVFYQQETAMGVVGRMFERKKVFYVKESIRTISTALTQNYLSASTEPKSTELEQILKAQLPALVPAGYVISDIKVEIVDEQTSAPIPNGPFATMLAPQTTVRFSYKVANSDEGENLAVGTIETTISLAQISMFQFMYFLDLNYSDWSPGPISTVLGRVHANGDFCVTGAQGVTFSKITSAGRIMHNEDARCRFRAAGSNVFVAAGPDLTDPTLLSDKADYGCRNCDRTGMGWATYALSRWHGNLLDKAHGVTALRLPVPEDVKVQAGVDRPNENKDNSKNLRFVIDPIVAGEPTEATEQKFAYRADIRIVDGVWFLKNPENQSQWPGVPIWSDHPGRRASDKLGQEDLRERWQTANPWPVGGFPRRFSFYEYDINNQTLTGDALGVVSYGTLARQGVVGDSRWYPAHWLDGASANAICGAGNTLTSAQGLLNAQTGVMTCQTGVSPGAATAYLNGTRSGFRDGHIQELFPSPIPVVRERMSKILPINIDVEQLQAALESTGPGELGSYFGADRFMGRAFNGVIYVTSTWPGSETGYDGTRPAQWPPQGSNVVPASANADPAQIPVTGPEQQQALPFQLCGEEGAGGVATWPFDKIDATSRFRIPSCTDYLNGTRRAFVNAVRVINGSGLIPTKIPSGLSVISNLPVYIAGSYNKNSDPDADPEDNAKWIPALVAGDQVSFLSEAWDDGNARWNERTDVRARAAVSTTYNLAVLMGWARSAKSIPVHASHALLEDWRGTQLRHTGSVVVGYYPVYYRQGRFWDPQLTYAPGVRTIRLDPHFNHMASQPKGTPIFHVSAIVNWKSD